MASSWASGNTKAQDRLTYHGSPRHKLLDSFMVTKLKQKQTWQNKLHQIKESTRAWDDSGLTMKGKVAVVNIFILSKLWYTAEVIPPPKDIIKKIDRVIFTFLWGSKTEHVSRISMFLPPPPSQGAWGSWISKAKWLLCRVYTLGTSSPKTNKMESSGRVLVRDSPAGNNPVQKQRPAFRCSAGILQLSH